MWMIFIGPLVSQSMPMNHHAGMSMPMPMVMAGTQDTPMDGASDPAAHHAHAGHGAGHDGQLHVLWEKCGYCSLLFNCPALPQTLSPLALGHLPPPLHLAPTVRAGHGRAAFFPGARSRAPPFPSIV